MSSVNFLAALRDKSETSLKTRYRRYRVLMDKGNSVTTDEMEELTSLVELLRLTPAEVESHNRTLTDVRLQKQIESERALREKDQEQTTAVWNAWCIERDRLKREMDEKNHRLNEAMRDAGERYVQLQKTQSRIDTHKQAHPLLFNEEDKTA